MNNPAQCIAMGCTNPVVRVLASSSLSVSFGVCEFHGHSIVKYGTDEQVRRYVFPSEEEKPEASPG